MPESDVYYIVVNVLQHPPAPYVFQDTTVELSDMASDYNEPPSLP
jgi:hypothetical protein